MIKNYLTWPWILSVPLLLIAFGCSVFFTGTDNVLIAPSIACLLAYVCIALYPNFKNGWDIPRTNTALFVLLFWVWIFASSFWSSVPYISTLFTIIISILPVFFLVSVMAPDPGQWVKVHSGALWAALGSFAVWALIQFFFMYEQYGPRIHHPMLNPNNLSGLFNLGLFPALGMFFLAKSRKAIAITAFVAVLFYLALVVTQSRGGYLACLIGLAVFIPFIAFKNPGGLPWKKILFLATAFSLLPFVSNIYNDGALEYNLIRENQMGDIRTLEDRFYMWESTWNIIKDHFWLGIGLASFYFYYPRYRQPLDRSDGFFSHMDPLQMWAETGVMAPILFYAVLICILLRTIRAVQKAGPDMRKRLEIIAPFCGMLVLTGHTHITFHLYMPGMLLPLSAFLSYWYLATERALVNEQGRRGVHFGEKGKMIVGALFIFALLMTGGWVARISASTYLMGQVQQAMAKGDLAGASGSMDLVRKVAPGSYGRYYEYEARFRVARLISESGSLPKEDVRSLYDDALYYLDEAEKRNPAFTTLWDLRARAHMSVHNILIPNGQDLAIDLLKKILEANPLAVDSRMGLSNIYKSRGEFKKALRVLEDGVQWPRPKGTPDLNFLVALAKLKLQMGDRKGHDLYMGEAMKRARQYGMRRQGQ